MTLNVNNYFTYFKWTVLTRCSTFIFSLLEYALTTGQWFKIFKILLRFRRVIKILLRFRRVIKILGKQKTDFLGSHTLGRFTCRGMTTRRVSFGGFFIDSSGYNTLGRLTRQGIILTCRAIIPPVILTRPEIIPRGDWKIGITCEFKNIFTHWSVTQKGSNYEKKIEVKNLIGPSL